MRSTRRMIHSKIWDSDQFSLIKPLERLLYIGMISIADDYGRLRGDGNFLRKRFFYSCKIGIKKIEKMRDRIKDVGLIEVYSAKNNVCISHPNWIKYQTLDKSKAKPSDFPEPPSAYSNVFIVVDPPEVKISEGKVIQGNTIGARQKMLSGLPSEKRASFTKGS